MDKWILYLIFIPVAYLVGSINFAVVISKFKNKNIKKIGSGNPGTMNMLRSVGKFWGCATFVLDFFKGVAMALIGMYVINDGPIGYCGYGVLGVYALGLATIFGHIFSCFLKFKGGKGVATSLGVFGVGDPIAMLIAFVLLLTYLYFFKTGFIGSLLVISSLVICDSIIYRTDFRVILILISILILVFFTHRKNIIRLLKGEENSLSLFKADKSKEENLSKPDISKK